MLSSLLGLLVLSSLCSAMLNTTTTMGLLPAARGMPYINDGSPLNPTESSGSGGGGRMLGPPPPGMPLMPDYSICDMLWNAPADQIPYFCLCMHCKGTIGPKGDRGDRGPRGMYIALNYLLGRKTA